MLVRSLRFCARQGPPGLVIVISVRVGATNTARAFGLYPRKGVLAEGADADIVVFDPEGEATVDDRFYHCLCEVSIYRGWTFRGLARTTIVRGRVVMENGETVGQPGWGRYVPRGPAARETAPAAAP
ncbi:MAG: amidohydrolase family protein [Candidatus Rokubacteria bacterium]|nr:amidohydrolase family protein [Candidatus Rokubacteria bacterium]